MFPDRTPHPSLFEVKHLQQPFLFSLDDDNPVMEVESGVCINLRISNENLFTSLPVKMSYTINDKKTGIQMVAGMVGKTGLIIPPGTTRQLPISIEHPSPVVAQRGENFPGVGVWITITTQLSTDSPWASKGHIIGQSQLELRLPNSFEVAPSAGGAWAIDDTGPGRICVKETATNLKLRSQSPNDPNSCAVAVEFDKTTGRLVRYALTGTQEKDLISSGPMPNFYRAPTDNDLGGMEMQMGMFPDLIHKMLAKYVAPFVAHQTSVAGRWRKAGLDKPVIESANFSHSTHPTGHLVTTNFAVQAPGPTRPTPLFEVAIKYIFYRNAALDIDVRVVTKHPSPSKLPPLPRVGLQLELPASFSSMTYLGRGPHESYPDRKQGALMGLYTGAVEDQYVPYIFPTENGGKTDVSHVSFVDEEGDGILIKSLRQNLELMNASKFSLQQLESARHTVDLPSREQAKLLPTVLHLDHKHSGLGGDASWIPSVLRDYQVDACKGPFEFAVKLYPLVNVKGPNEISKIAAQLQNVLKRSEGSPDA